MSDDSSIDFEDEEDDFDFENDSDNESEDDIEEDTQFGLYGNEPEYNSDEMENLSNHVRLLSSQINTQEGKNKQG